MFDGVVMDVICVMMQVLLVADCMLDEARRPEALPLVAIGLLVFLAAAFEPFGR